MTDKPWEAEPILCPVCGADRIRLVAGDLYPEEPEIVLCSCQACGKNFDVSTSLEGMGPAPVSYDRDTGQVQRIRTEDDDG